MTITSTLWSVVKLAYVVARHPIEAWYVFEHTTRDPRAAQRILIEIKVCDDCGGDSGGACDYHTARIQKYFRDEIGFVPSAYEN